MYRFEEPIYFYWLLILPAVWLLYILLSGWKRRKRKEFAEGKLIDNLIPELSPFKSILKLVFWSLFLLWSIVALVNPKIGTALKTVKRSGVDVVFAMDISKSMLAEDIAPSRLEKAKKIVRGVLDKLGGDRVGIIVYAGDAYPVLPMTTDHAAARLFLDNIGTDMVSRQGTAISQAMEIAARNFDDDEQTHRFLFILSDGEDHEKNWNDALDNLRRQSVKTFTVGIGTAKGGPIPVRKRGGVSYKKDRNGQTVITRLDRNTLKEIAQEAGGAYIDGNRTRDAIKAISDIIVHADKKEYESKELLDYQDQFQWFIAAALFFLLLDTFMLERKTKWIQELNLFDGNEK